ncbi:hypothetical protein Malapachy_0126 [Malassezia pachydermatis]|uniref:G-patch domain-containing protein n=1 Tax=Malassezia pachydermatis TaxID=77020 RepID=A0A0M8MMW2_9BASI|nr:hypothetical protein Malapachy_0126 [Malassezia pachydermatis]KOS13317.1 hypothetical protein Malapachy_0126 [Malassezia pachydermatis]
MNYAADYDPSRPNDYTQFKAQVQEWRMQRGLYDESESDHDDRPHNPRFAPPTSYAPVAGPYSLMEVVAPSTPTPTAPPPPSAALPPGPPPVPPPSLQARTAKVEPKPSAPAFVRASDHLDTPPSPLPISQAQVDSDPSTFAERLMAKYGYKEGEGLGAEGNKGIVTPLQASHIPAKGKRRRGAIINENVDAEQEYTKSRYGNPSEVIVLTSFSTAQATEEELRQAISTECKHYGFVQRIQLYPMENEQRVQAFVLFTGMAGAYRAVRAMDGWSYGNEYIRCRYYPASSFHAGHFVALQSGST